MMFFVASAPFFAPVVPSAPLISSVPVMSSISPKTSPQGYKHDAYYHQHNDPFHLLSLLLCAARHATNMTRPHVTGFRLCLGVPKPCHAQATGALV
jgi:hypothetical protein